MRGMEVFRWIGTHWVDLVQSAGIVSAFLFSAYTIRREAQLRRVNTMLELSKQHNAIWRELAECPELLRVMDNQPALDTAPITPQEQRFVTALILHLDGVHRAMRSGMFVKLEGLRPDIQVFFALPIPKTVWQSAKPFQDKAFVRFVEDCLNEPARA